MAPNCVGGGRRRRRRRKKKKNPGSEGKEVQERQRSEFVNVCNQDRKLVGSMGNRPGCEAPQKNKEKREEKKM